jgi:DNA polymerase-3 subunit delta
MILFLYGEDTYRSKQKLDAIKAKYISANLGDTNLSIIDFEEKQFSFDQITREMLVFPFLANSRLVVIKNLLLKGKKDIQEKIKEFLPKIPESTNLIIFENGIPDKRSSMFKKINKPQTSQEFKLLETYQLKKWIENEVKNHGATVESSAVSKLIEYVGNDLWKLSNEIKKLTAYSLQLTTPNIELLVRPRIEGNVFTMIDAIGQKDTSRAAKHLHDLIDSGENELYIFTMLIYQFRNLLIVKDIMKISKSKFSMSNMQIAKLAGLNPYVVQKTINQCGNFSFEELKLIYQKLLKYDIKIKTGKIDSNIALDIFIAELYKN